MLEAATLSGLGTSGSEAKDMLSGETVVGGVELKDAAFEKIASVSVGVLLEKLDSHSNEPSSPIAAVGISMAAIVALRMDVATVVVAVCARCSTRV
jgi:hypothetical protein